MRPAPIIHAAALALALALAPPATAQGGDRSASVSERLTLQLTRVVRHSDQRSVEPAILALRSLEDPKLRPLFAHLTTRPAVSSRVHGWLGLAELEDDQALNVELVRRAPEPEVRALALGSAIRQGVLGREGIEAALGWPHLEPTLELLLCSRLMRETGSLDEARVQRVIDDTPTERVGPRILGELLLAHARGERSADAAWQILEATGPLGFEPTSTIALSHILSEELDGVAGFVERVMDQAEPGSTVELDALRTLLAIDPPAGLARWGALWERAEGAAARLRAALILLERAGELPASAFDPLADEPGLLGTIARAGAAIADGSNEAAVIDALESRHSPTVAAVFAALGAMEEEALADALSSLLVVWIARQDGGRPPAPLFEVARVLAGLAPEALVDPIRDAAAAGDAPLCHALLIAMLEGEPDRVWEGELAPAWPDRRSRVLAAMVRARVGEPLDPESTELLESAALGGESLPSALKALAAWLALVARGEEGPALAEALAPPGSPGAWR
jgi:hypothetical protein